MGTFYTFARGLIQQKPNIKVMILKRIKLNEEKSKKITNKIEQKRVSGIRLPREREILNAEIDKREFKKKEREKNKL
jgi:hypothetical protein